VRVDAAIAVGVLAGTRVIVGVWVGVPAGQDVAAGASVGGGSNLPVAVPVGVGSLEEGSGARQATRQSDVRIVKIAFIGVIIGPIVLRSISGSRRLPCQREEQNPMPAAYHQS
jgi:hypothetical protein